jgi:hypothetical protein
MKSPKQTARKRPIAGPWPITWKLPSGSGVTVEVWIPHRTTPSAHRTSLQLGMSVFVALVRDNHASQVCHFWEPPVPKNRFS